MVSRKKVIRVRRYDILFFSRRLKALREQAQLTQEVFAEYVGMGYKNYQHVEAGRRWNLRLETALRLIAAHGLSPAQFYGDKMPTTALVAERAGLPRRRRAT